MPSQIQQITLPAFAWLENLLATKIQAGQIIGSSPGVVVGENLMGFVPTSLQRHGSVLLNYNPPRLRSLYQINDVNVNLPSVSLALDVEETESEFVLKGKFGWIVALKINNIPIYSEPLEPEGFEWNKKKGFAEKTEIVFSKKPLSQQLQFTQQLEVPPGNPVDLAIDTYFVIDSIVGPKVPKGEEWLVALASGSGEHENGPASFQTVLVHDLNFPASRGETGTTF